MHVPALDRRAAVAIALAAIAVLLALVSLSMQAPCTHPDLGILEAPVLEEAEGGIVIPPALALFESRGSHGIRSFQPPRTREGMGRYTALLCHPARTCARTCA